MRQARLIHNGVDIDIRVSVTETVGERMRGLLGRAALERNEALLLRRCRSIHTVGMRFAVDVLFIDRLGRVVAVHRDVGGARMLFSLRGRDALELRAGAAFRDCIRVGDPLAFEPLR